MGVETIITCDSCNRILKDEDYMSAELKLEIDRNHTEGTDYRDRFYRLICLDCRPEFQKQLARVLSFEYR
jgi:ribosomal protein S27E